MPVRVRNPRQALGDYLDEMLHQATIGAAEVPLPKDGPEMRLRGEMPPTAAESEMLDRNADAHALPGGQDTDNNSSRVPATNEFPMQCLMFRAGGHLLSIPLIQLSSVVSWSDALTRLPESPRWLLGLLKHRDVNLRIVDSRLLLDIDCEIDNSPEHLLVLGEGGWAITCDHLEQVVNLDYDDVQWKRGDADQLVLGTIRDSLSTLLDPAGIARFLDERNAAPVGD